MSRTDQADAKFRETVKAPAELSADCAESCWYAAYTNSRHEKRVAQQMEERQIQCFLPLYKSVRHWKDRRKQVDLPLFPGYVFVRIALHDRLRVLALPGVAQIISFGGKPAPVPEGEIEAIRNSLFRNASLYPHPYLKVGRRVRVRNGPMAGVEGILARRKDRFRIVLTIDLLMRSIAAEVDEADIEPLN